MTDQKKAKAKAGLEKAMGYTFTNPKIVNEAVVRHRNERLAFLGDKVVGMILLDIWYRTRKSCAQGYSRLQNYATNRAMARRAIKLHLDKFVESESSQSQHHQDSLGVHSLATEIEALIGAVWVDSGRDFEAVKNVMKRLQLCPDSVGSPAEAPGS